MPLRAFGQFRERLLVGLERDEHALGSTALAGAWQQRDVADCREGPQSFAQRPSRDLPRLESGLFDGRDVDPKSGKGFLIDLTHFCSDKNAKLATVVGRYYAMDRDKRWERVKLAYDVMVNAEGEKVKDISGAMQKSYDAGVTDEFIKPLVLTGENGQPLTKIAEGDMIIFFNFRTDRGRELTQALSQQDFHEQNMHKMDLYYVTMTNYDDSFKGIKVVYDKENIKNP